jgi:hypothetical protein
MSAELADYRFQGSGVGEAKRRAAVLLSRVRFRDNGVMA